VKCSGSEKFSTDDHRGSSSGGPTIDTRAWSDAAPDD